MQSEKQIIHTPYDLALHSYNNVGLLMESSKKKTHQKRYSRTKEHFFFLVTYLAPTLLTMQLNRKHFSQTFRCVIVAANDPSPL